MTKAFVGSWPLQTVHALLILVVSACDLRSEAKSHPPEKQSVGWIETVSIAPGDVVFHAKLDTGADNGSIHAFDITPFKKDGKDWVRFSIQNRHGERQTLEREIIRIARIKRVMGSSQERYVVRLAICLGNTKLETEVNLVDRSNFSYPVLIGRSFLAGNVTLDPSKSYTVQPNCNNGS